MFNPRNEPKNVSPRSSQETFAAIALPVFSIPTKVHSRISVSRKGQILFFVSVLDPVGLKSNFVLDEKITIAWLSLVNSTRNLFFLFLQDGGSDLCQPPPFPDLPDNFHLHDHCLRGAAFIVPFIFRWFVPALEFFFVFCVQQKGQKLSGSCLIFTAILLVLETRICRN